MSELIDIQKILNDDSGSFSTLEYQLAERVEKDEQQRDVAIERAAHWKDQHDKAMQYGKRMEHERDEARAALRRCNDRENERSRNMEESCPKHHGCLPDKCGNCEADND